MPNEGQEEKQSQAPGFRFNMATVIPGIAIAGVVGVFSFVYYIGLDFRVHQREDILEFARLDDRIDDVLTFINATIASMHEPVNGLSQRDRIVLNTNRLDILIADERKFHETVGDIINGFRDEVHDYKSESQRLRRDVHETSRDLERVRKQQDEIRVSVEWCKKQVWEQKANGS